MDDVRHSARRLRAVLRPRIAVTVLALALQPLPVMAQTTVPAPRPVESQPLPPLPGATTPAPEAPKPPEAAPSTGLAAPSAPAQAHDALAVVTLVPASADPSNPDQVELTARPAATLSGTSTWDEGYDTLTRSFDRLAAEMAKAGIKVTGKPLATFLETDDNGFKFMALLPIAAAPALRPAGLPPEVQFGTSPSGKAVRFVHKAPYDDIDSTYEAVSAYLDAKGIEVKDAFTEEYVTLGTGPGDTALELNIFVLPK